MRFPIPHHDHHDETDDQTDDEVVDLGALEAALAPYTNSSAPPYWSGTRSTTALRERLANRRARYRISERDQ